MILLLPVDVTLYFMPTSFGGFAVNVKTDDPSCAVGN